MRNGVRDGKWAEKRVVEAAPDERSRRSSWCCFHGFLPVSQSGKELGGSSPAVVERLRRPLYCPEVASQDSWKHEQLRQAAEFEIGDHRALLLSDHRRRLESADSDQTPLLLFPSCLKPCLLHLRQKPLSPVQQTFVSHRLLPHRAPPSGKVNGSRSRVT
jgi:hypothetical protein